jgi:histone acetyltransferase (RNA polymerase elongator complex component)
MQLAEDISLHHDYTYISVIAGVWVRKYYEKIWYHLVGSYMHKKIS